jgi:hypothetical protein
MKMYVLLSLLLLAVSAPMKALAVEQCAQNNNAIGLVGLDSHDGMVYAAVSSDSNECGCASVRFNPHNGVDVDKALSVLLAAKGMNKRVRVDLHNSQDCDSAYRAYIH